jgi:hypothetical protein
MPKVLQEEPNTDSRICDPFGGPMPPYIVLEKGEPLREALSNVSVGTIAAAKVRHNVSPPVSLPDA